MSLGEYGTTYSTRNLTSLSIIFLRFQYIKTRQKIIVQHTKNVLSSQMKSAHTIKVCVVWNWKWQPLFNHFTILPSIWYSTHKWAILSHFICVYKTEISPCAMLCCSKVQYMMLMFSRRDGMINTNNYYSTHILLHSNDCYEKSGFHTLFFITYRILIKIKNFHFWKWWRKIIRIACC